MESWWKYTTTVACAVLLAVLGAALSWDWNYVTAEECRRIIRVKGDRLFITESQTRRMIVTESAYVSDRMIVHQNSKSVAKLLEITQKLTIGQIEANTKLDLLLQRVGTPLNLE